MTLTGLVVLIIGIILAIALHELGHLIPAKIFGVKVPRYFIGFGPTLFSKTVRGTEYGVKAIPLGGFVQLNGMYAPAEGAKLVNRKGQLTLAAEARQVSADQIEPGEEESAFYRLSVPKKLTVMFGGPFVNLILALLLSTVLLVGIGAPALLSQVGGIPECVSATGQCTENDPATPAEEGGLRAGDDIISWGGTPTESWNDVQQAIAEGRAAPTDVVVERGGEQMTLTVTPVLQERPVADEDGQPVLENGQAVTRTVPYVGIAPAVGLERQPFLAVPAYVGDMLTQVAGVVVRLPQHLWNLTADFVTGQERDQTSIVGIVGVAQVAGQITGAEIEGYSAIEKSADLINLLVALNISLFAFNMLPLLPLDGGHIAGALYEGAKRHWAKLRGRPDPGPADTARLMPLSYAVATAFILMTVILVVVDVFDPVTLF